MINKKVVKKEFSINDFLTLKLEKEYDLLETSVYIAGERFKQCKYLLMEISVERKKRLDEIKSIDEAAKYLNCTLEGENMLLSYIPSKVEFWAHCSNLQAWAENNYDTRLLHSNLSFPLLKRLTEVGDSKAKRVFKCEIGKRLASGYSSVVRFLKEEKYLDYLTEEEIVVALSQIEWEKDIDEEHILLDFPHNILLKAILEPEEAQAVLELEQIINKEIPISIRNYKDKLININKRHINWLDIPSLNKDHKLKTIPKLLIKFKYLEDLFITDHEISKIPNIIGELEFLKNLYLFKNNITSIPQSIERLKNLKILNLAKNPLEVFPSELSGLKSLEVLILNNCNLKEVPEFIKSLESLKSLDLRENNINKLPRWLKEKKSSIRLRLIGNPIYQLYED
ncbi:MAG: leucine-rich repeat domain-containing protein [Promethearchaeota archaeon]